MNVLTTLAIFIRLLRTIVPRKYRLEVDKSIWLPSLHRLDFYQSQFKNYNKKIGKIAEVVFKKYPTAAAVDVGANVGDTSLQMARSSGVKVYALEGNPIYLKYLLSNTKDSRDSFQVIPNFLCPHSNFSGFIKTERGTGSIKETETDVGNQLPCITFDDLSRILGKKAIINKLLKIDTDGLDFDLLEAAIPFIAEHQPALYFEFDVVYTKKTTIEIMDILEKLAGLGYDHYVYYDNFGNYHLSMSGFDQNVVKDLIVGLRQNHSQGGRLPYFDLLLFHMRDIDLFQEVRCFEYESAQESLTT